MALLDRQRRQRLIQAGGYFLAWTVAGLFFFTQDLTRRAVIPDPNP